MSSIENLLDENGELRTVKLRVSIPKFLTPVLQRRWEQLKADESELGRMPIVGRRSWRERQEELTKERERLQLLENYEANVASPDTRADTLFAAIHVVGQESDRLHNRYQDMLPIRKSQEEFARERLLLRARQEDAAAIMRQLLFPSAFSQAA